MMNRIKLTCSVATNPDAFVGFEYYIKAGDEFDSIRYAQAYKLNPADIDADDVQVVKDASSKLNNGECLMVSHSISHDD